jgi:hypothetical protein
VKKVSIGEVKPSSNISAYKKRHPARRCGVLIHIPTDTNDSTTSQSS